MFENITLRHDLVTDASWEVYFILAVAFILGFLFCYMQSKQDN